MANEEEIRFRVSADAEDATRNLDKVADATQNVARETKASGDVMEDAAAALEERGQAAAELADALSEQERAELDAADATREGGKAADEANQSLTWKQRAIESLNGALGGMVTRWIGALAIGREIVRFFNDIADAARKAAAAVVSVGESTRGLTANVGASTAKAVFEGTTEIAGENRFNVQGRADLLAAVSALTDLREGLTQDQILEETRRLATLQRATGVGGADAARLLLSLQENLGLGGDQAVDFGAVALNSGLTADSLQQIVDRAGNVGGMDLVAALIAARGTGLDPNRASRSVPTLIAALTKNDASGNVDPLLASAGVTAEMPIIERLQKLLEARDAGRLNAGQFNEAIGGAEQLRTIAPLERVLQRNLIPQARAALTDAQAVENTIAELQRNEFVRAQERQNVRELAAQVRRERSGLTAVGEELADFEASTQDLPGIVQSLAFVGNLPNLINPSDPEDTARLNEQATQAPQGQPSPQSQQTPATAFPGPAVEPIPAGGRDNPPVVMEGRGPLTGDLETTNRLLADLVQQVQQANQEHGRDMGKVLGEVGSALNRLEAAKGFSVRRRDR